MTNPPDAVNRVKHRKTLGCRVPTDTYQAFAMVAEKMQLTESELLRSLIARKLAKGLPETDGQPPPAQEGISDSPAKQKE